MLILKCIFLSKLGINILACLYLNGVACRVNYNFSIDMRAGFRNRTPSANLATYLWASFFACSTKMLSTTSCKLVLANRASAAVCAS